MSNYSYIVRILKSDGRDNYENKKILSQKSMGATGDMYIWTLIENEKRKYKLLLDGKNK